MQGRFVVRGLVAPGAVALALILSLPATDTGAASPSRSAGSSTASPGITSSTITVGQVDDISLPVPGLFRAAEVGTKAYLDYLNSTGGVDGRKVVLDARDSDFNTATVVTDTEAQAKSDFALVGGYSLLDQAEKPIIDEYKVPDITYPLATSLANDAHVYSPSPSTINDTLTGPYEWAKRTFGDEASHVGILYSAATPTTVESEHILDSAMQASGLKIAYRRGFAASESTFTSDVLKMRGDGVSMYFDQQLPGIYAATLTKESALQGFHPTNIQGIAAYVDNMQQLSGGQANRMYLVQQAALYEGEDAKSVPEVALLDKWAKKVDPGVFSLTTPLPALDGWASGMLFAQALKAAGPNPTRASLEAQLNKITSFNAGGLLPPGENPAKNVPSRCFLVARLENGMWQRVGPTPRKGFVCTGSLRPQKGWKPQSR